MISDGDVSRGMMMMRRCAFVHATTRGAIKSHSRVITPVPSSPALGPWAPPAERGPSLESIYRVSLTIDLCEG